MTLCLNPACPSPENADSRLYCVACGRGLLVGDRYRPLAAIGQGGFGRTFRAQDEQALEDGACVIKQLLLRGGTQADPTNFQQRFHQEAQRLRKLGQHPQIPQLLDYGEDANGSYLIQTLIAGSTLAQLLQHQGPFNEAKIRDLLHQLLPVLQFIHGAQLIHRDIKPANIIRERVTNRYVLVDFGASKLMSPEALQNTGTVIGSAGYVAPEQAVGKAVFASDLYSLGVTCVHLMTGQHPFDLYSLGEDRWVWRPYVDGEMSGQLGQLIDRLLSRPLRQRYQYADQALADLQAPVPPLKSAAQKFLSRSKQGEKALVRSRPLPKLDIQYLRTLNQPMGSVVNQLAVSPDGKAIATGSTDHGVRLWDWATGDCLHCFRKRLGLGAGHRDQVTSVAFRVDGRTLYSSSLDGTLRLWDLSHYRLIATLPSQGWGTATIALAPNSQILASGGTDGKITIWDLANRQRLVTLVQHQDWISALIINTAGDRLFSSSRDGTVRLWHLPSGRLLQTLSDLSDCITSLALTPDGITLVGGSAGGTVSLWNLSHNFRCRTLDAHGDEITAIALSPDGKLLVTGSADSTLRIWHLATGELLLKLNHGWAITAIAFTPDGTHLISSSQDETLKIWRFQVHGTSSKRLN
ncbi:MAG: serine/threonine-protein kinase [Cyanobacteria bacterium J06642_9]